MKSESSKLNTSTDENPLLSAYCTDKTICSVNLTLLFFMKSSISTEFDGKVSTRNDSVIHLINIKYKQKKTLLM